MIATVRIVTYNIHRCHGMDRRIRPNRIAQVLRETDPDIVALQEVLSFEGRTAEANQALFIANSLGFGYCVGETRRLYGGSYGNVTLSRWPISPSLKYDLSFPGLEKRGCLRADTWVAGKHLLHIFNVHLGTSYLERRYQARKLIAPEILSNSALVGARVILGDFNEWTRGLVSRLLSGRFESIDIRKHLLRKRTYPGFLPILHLDHIYFDPVLTLERLTLDRSSAALIASDHLPLVAEFKLPPLPKDGDRR